MLKNHMIEIVKTQGVTRLVLLRVLIIVLASSLLNVAQAHTPICDCYDNADGTISCEGGFSDGASAAGIEMQVVDTSGRVLLEGEMSEYSEYTFNKPIEDFFVRYLAGEGHVIEIDSRDIEE